MTVLRHGQGRAARRVPRREDAAGACRARQEPCAPPGAPRARMKKAALPAAFGAFPDAARAGPTGDYLNRDCGTVFSSPGSEAMYLAMVFSSAWLKLATMPAMMALERPTCGLSFVWYCLSATYR